ncbi:uncharacterized protein LY79DRAFT_663953 [Colletotrichum navitas]|uniref:Uncharacterized protein n=1 Tax=Colletotrichum navitas TaxID=681940 RepID=A0AAD8PJI3_9PEZI|nr:uncharacterized protein LY79DRAFT_663953 [Colletotrichum navitas]KAK1565995.1 hypothetical protein LY79DRAFT_663953 [Colletotrichum navitas]
MFGNFIISYAAPWFRSNGVANNRIFYPRKMLDQTGIRDTVKQTRIQVILNSLALAVAVFGSFMLDVLNRRFQSYIIGGPIKSSRHHYVGSNMITEYGESINQSGLYGNLAIISFFQGFYTFYSTPMTRFYPTEISRHKLLATGTAVFRMLDADFGLVDCTHIQGLLLA